MTRDEALRRIKTLSDPDREPFKPDARDQVLAMRDVTGQIWLLACEALAPTPDDATDSGTVEGIVTLTGVEASTLLNMLHHDINEEFNNRREPNWSQIEFQSRIAGKLHPLVKKLVQEADRGR